MAIDREREQVIPLRQVPNYVPSRSPGKRVSPSTVWRWTLRRPEPLETFATPGGRFTSVEAVGRFIDRISTAKGIGMPSAAGPSDDKHRRTGRQRSNAAGEAGDQLNRLIDGGRQSRQ